MTVVETRPTTLHGWHEEVRRLAADGEFERAIDILERLVDAVPDRRRLQQDLVRLYRQADRPVAADKLAVQLDPGDHRAWFRLARVARVCGDAELFEISTDGWVRATPDCPIARHFADAAVALADPAGEIAQPDPAYIEQVFDHYADTFDEHLASLGYTAPAAVAASLHDRVGSGRVADLGCGTGLVGVELAERDWAGELLGVDLSSKMIEAARSRTELPMSGYASLETADLHDFLAGVVDPLDGIVSADVVIYVGDLRPMLASAADALRSGGWLVFTTERAADGQAPRGFLPQMNGRFVHDDGWVHAVLIDAGFDSIEIDAVELREEGGEPVPASLVVARRA